MLLNKVERPAWIAFFVNAGDISIQKNTALLKQKKKKSMLLLFCFSKVAFKQEYQQNQQLYKIVKTKKLTGKETTETERAITFLGMPKTFLILICIFAVIGNCITFSISFLLF